MILYSTGHLFSHLKLDYFIKQKVLFLHNFLSPKFHRNLGLYKMDKVHHYIQIVLKLFYTNLIMFDF